MHREVDMMKTIDSPFVLKVFDSFLFKNADDSEIYYVMVLPVATCDLYTKFKRERLKPEQMKSFTA